MVQLTCDATTLREPETVAYKMHLWRQGLAALPSGYVAYHEGLANTEWAALKNTYHFRLVGQTWLESDGWFDGMKTVNLVVRTESGELLHLRWMDGSLCFFKAAKHGGWAQLQEEDLR